MKNGNGQMRMKIGDRIRCVGFVITKTDRLGFNILVNDMRFWARDLREARRVGAKWRKSPIRPYQLALDFLPR
jgi:hypothetical protein